MTLEERQEQDSRDIRAIFQTREGARFFSLLLDTCGVYDTSYRGEDTHATAFKEGQRNIGLLVLGALDRADSEARAKLARADKERTVTE